LVELLSFISIVWNKIIWHVQLFWLFKIKTYDPSELQKLQYYTTWQI
jgi:hypothetical protein